MAPKSTRSRHPSSTLLLLFLLAVSSTAASYPLHRRDVNRPHHVIDTVEAPSILNTNPERRPLLNQDATAPRRYVRLDDITEPLDEADEVVVIPAYRQDSAVADEEGVLDQGPWKAAVAAAVKEVSGWRNRLGRKIWGLGEGEGNVIGGRRADL